MFKHQDLDIFCHILNKYEDFSSVFLKIRLYSKQRRIDEITK